MSGRLPIDDHAPPADVRRRLGRALRRAGTRTAAYPTLWTEHGAAPSTACSPTDFHRLPIINKHDLLRFALAERCAVRAENRGVRVERTGGSTGEPFDVPIARGDRRRRQLRFLRALVQCGYRPGQRLMLLTAHGGGGRSRLLNWRYVPITLDEAALAEALLTHRPAVLYGPLNTLLGMARGLEARGARPTRLRALISTAEQLDPLAHRRLHEAFGIAPCDFYGMTETGLLAWRAGERREYQLATDDFLFEFLPSDEDPSLERLVVTGLTHAAMPLVRFDTGDLVLRERADPARPVIGFTGRQVDNLVMPDGERISPYRVTLALERIPGLDRFRVVQHADLSLEAEGWPGTASEVLERMRDSLLELTARRVPVRVDRGVDSGPAPARKFRPIRSAAGAAP